VRSCTKSASGVRYLRRSVYVRHLNCGPEKQQESAAKSKGDPPWVSSVLFGLLIVHHFNYNVPFFRGRDGRLGTVKKGTLFGMLP
jgi:hypothetical protein